MALEVEAVIMRIVFCLVVALVGCSKTNPNLCCVDETDCAAVGLADVQSCDDGLVCRGNQCIAEVCDASSECEASAPYCVAPPDGRCDEVCTDDSQCPGFGESADQAFCVGGACVQCRDGNDCSGSAPFCSSEGACVTCTTNDQCGSGVCIDDGTCADEGDVAYVALTGSPTGACTQSAPCTTIEFALSLMPARPFIVIDSGTYSRGVSLTLAGTRRLIGRGLTRPIIKRTTPASIIAIDGDITLEYLQVEGATGPKERLDIGGNAVTCNTMGAASVRIVDSVLRSNTSLGLAAQNCTVELIGTSLTENAASGLEATDSNITIDRSTFSGNSFSGAAIDAGTASIRNSFFTRNTMSGLLVTFLNAGNVIEFNTIVDNQGLGFDCSIQTASSSFPNNIIARNMTQTGTSASCTYPNSIIIDSAIAPIKFVSPDVAPFDYHIQAGSLAIDMAAITTVDHDFDGQPRVSNTADVGADEL